MAEDLYSISLLDIVKPALFIIILFFVVLPLFAVLILSGLHGWLLIILAVLALAVLADGGDADDHEPMVSCPGCGSPNDHGASFCSHCGTKLG